MTNIIKVYAYCPYEIYNFKSLIVLELAVNNLSNIII